MKSLTLSLVLATSLFVGCSKQDQSTNSSNQQTQASITQQAQQEIKKGHLCGALTKKGYPCQRRVAADKKLCWQHDGLH